MEYCDGGTLRHFGQNAEVGEQEAAYLCREILKGLEYLHSFGQIHRDLKGDNVLLNLSGEVKIADLGLAADEKVASSHIAGTPGFIAPEMIKRTGYDTKLDIWSFSCLVVELIDGEPPYQSLPPLKRLMSTASNTSPTLKHPERYSKNFRHFISCCLRPDPNLRSSATQLLHVPLQFLSLCSSLCFISFIFIAKIGSFSLAKHPFIEQASGKEKIVTLFAAVFMGETLEKTGLL